MRPLIIVLLIVLAAAMIVIPTIFVTLLDPTESTKDPTQENIKLQKDNNLYIPVSIYRTKTAIIETYPLEEYVRGVVAAEMPVSFELEALKAQALAARTYIVKRILDKSFSDVPDGAVISDTVKHQVFISNQELKKMWGLEYQERISKLNQAINQTNGQVITYKGLPITALFFSTSNGYTINSEDYWGQEVDYLRSVASPWDNLSPKYEAEKTITFSQVQAKLDINPAQLASTGQEWIKILERTEGNSVNKIKIGEKVLSGRDVRELFDLNSASFNIKLTGEGITFQTKGYGHGVGMSQYGANGMAKEGKDAEEIIKYYYTGVSIKDVQEWVK